MSRFICSICGYEHVGVSAPDKCPICKAPSLCGRCVRNSG